MSEYVDPGTLPEDHPLRTKPLGEIGAQYWNKRREYGDWMLASEHKDVGELCYNDLYAGWITFTNWRVKIPNAARDEERKP